MFSISIVYASSVDDCVCSGDSGSAPQNSQMLGTAHETMNSSATDMPQHVPPIYSVGVASNAAVHSPRQNSGLVRNKKRNQTDVQCEDLQRNAAMILDRPVSVVNGSTNAAKKVKRRRKQRPQNV